MFDRSTLRSTFSLGSIDADDILDSKPALALHDFAGCEADGELSFKAGQPLDILIEEAVDGWSLALVYLSEEELQQGLVPSRFYRFLGSDEVNSSSWPAPDTLSRASKSPLGESSGGSFDKHMSSTAKEHAHSTDASPVETVSVDGAVFELPVPSMKAVIQETVDCFLVPAGTEVDTSQRVQDVNSKGATSPSLDEATAAVHSTGVWEGHKRLLHTIQATPGIPSDIQHAAFRKAKAHWNQIDPLEQKPNIQPLPPKLPQAPEERKSGLSLVMDGASQRIKSAPLPKSRSELPGGWVDSGAKEWVTSTRNVENLRQDERRKLDLSVVADAEHLEGDEWTVDSMLSWVPKTAPFNASVHSAKTVYQGQTGYTLFQVSSFKSVSVRTDLDDPSTDVAWVTVGRRFSHFAALEEALRRQYGGLVIPPLPDRRFLGRFDAGFVEQRQNDLERWLCRVLRHPVLRDSQALEIFLTSQVESLQLLQTLHGFNKRLLFEHIFHDEFAAEVGICSDEGASFEMFVKKEQGDGIYRRLKVALESQRTALHEMSLRNERVAQELAAVAQNPCWKDSCPECSRRSSILKKGSTALRDVAQLEENATRSWLKTVELAHEISRPHSQHIGLIDLQTSAAAAWEMVDAPGDFAEEEGGSTAEHAKMIVTDRCQCVLSVASAEMDRHHKERQEDRKQLALEVVGNQIKLHEAALKRLKLAQAEMEDQEDEKEGALAPVERGSMHAPSTWSLGDFSRGMMGLTSWVQHWRGVVSKLAPPLPPASPRAEEKTD